MGNGSLSFDVVGSNLNIAFTAGAGLNDIVTLYLDTKSGGFTEAQMNDTGDGGRTALSNLTRDVNDVLITKDSRGDGGFGMMEFPGRDEGKLNGAGIARYTFSK